MFRSEWIDVIGLLRLKHVRDKSMWIVSPDISTAEIVFIMFKWSLPNYLRRHSMCNIPNWTTVTNNDMHWHTMLIRHLDWHIPLWTWNKENTSDNSIVHFIRFYNRQRQQEVDYFIAMQHTFHPARQISNNTAANKAEDTDRLYHTHARTHVRTHARTQYHLLHFNMFP